MRRRLSRRRDRGLTLLELVIAIAILSLGTLATMNATGQATRVLGGAAPRALALVVAENHAEALRLPDAGTPPGRVVVGPYSFRVEVERRATASGLVEARVVVRSDQGPGASLVTILPPGGRP